MRKLFLSTLSAALAVTTACGGDSSTGPSSVAGTYSLTTVNSAPLPYVFLNDASGKIEITSDVYVISDNGTYTNPTIIRSTISGEVTTDTLTSNGTYTVSGNSITLTDASDPTSKLSGTVTTSGLTITAEGFVLVYQRSGS
jgi:hypothetical protein